MKNGYDNVSLFYDRLSKLIFGKKLIQAQQYLIDTIPADCHLLIVGGGSGWILDAITALHPSGMNITYIDASPKMIAKAEKHNTGRNNVEFIARQVQDIPLGNDYDVVITPFLFDNFPESEAQLIFRHLDRSLRPEGTWLYADFQNTSNATHKFLLNTMYLFFRLLCGVQAQRLPDMAQQFTSTGFKVLKERFFLGGFVISRSYSRINSTIRS